MMNIHMVKQVIFTNSKTGEILLEVFQQDLKE